MNSALDQHRVSLEEDLTRIRSSYSHARIFLRHTWTQGSMQLALLLSLFIPSHKLSSRAYSPVTISFRTFSRPFPLYKPVPLQCGGAFRIPSLSRRIIRRFSGENSNDGESSLRYMKERVLQILKGLKPREVSLSWQHFFSRARNDTKALLANDSLGNATAFPSHPFQLAGTLGLNDASGDRWATASEFTDLSGSWKPIVTTKFKQEYDEYLQNCSESYLFRQVVRNSVGLTQEQISQEKDGRDLIIKSANPAGSWKRTLVSSGKSNTCKQWEPIHSELKDPEGDVVRVEAWWEDNGRVHRSWLRGKPRVHGGSFETLRFLDPEDRDILICVSRFHPPNNTKYKEAEVVWRYERQK